MCMCHYFAKSSEINLFAILTAHTMHEKAAPTRKCIHPQHFRNAWWSVWMNLFFICGLSQWKSMSAKRRREQKKGRENSRNQREKTQGIFIKNKWKKKILLKMANVFVLQGDRIWVSRWQSPSDHFCCQSAFPEIIGWYRIREITVSCILQLVGRHWVPCNEQLCRLLTGYISLANLRMVSVWLFRFRIRRGTGPDGKRFK